MKNLVLACVLAFGAVSVSSVAVAGTEMEKCDKSGKPCKDGAECKPENCKKPKQ